MLRYFIYGIFLLLTSIVPINTYAQEKNDLCNPKPSKDDLILPGPNGICFTFRPVFVQGATPMEGEVFYMGDAQSDDFRTPITKVMVGGTFASEDSDDMWVYYLGKYEVSRAQYKAIMGSLPADLKDTQSNAENDSLPVTNVSYFEAIQFIDKLNQWLYTNALESMPKSGNFPGFVRLPSEMEWEFAARGGKLVQKSDFEASTVYGDNLTKHEWFYGTNSSHGKIKQIGLLEPNPLGLHDMLGNVQEITSSQYQVRYYEGRSGGFVSRGGSFITAENKIRSAMRQEEPFYLMRGGKKITPNTKATLGFRLAISAPLLTDRDAIDELEEAYEEFVEKQSSATSTNNQTQLSPAVLSISPMSDQANANVHDALIRVQNLRAASPEQAVKTLRQELAYAEEALRETIKIRKEADQSNATAWVKQTHFFGQELSNYLARINAPYVLKRVEELKNKENLNKNEAKFLKRYDDLVFNTKRLLERYGESHKELSNLSPTVVAEAFKIRQNETQSDKALEQSEISKALQVLELVQQHYKEFLKTKRVDIKKWQEHFINTFKL